MPPPPDVDDNFDGDDGAGYEMTGETQKSAKTPRIMDFLIEA
jgi:hypothetical protein